MSAAIAAAPATAPMMNHRLRCETTGGWRRLGAGIGLREAPPMPLDAPCASPRPRRSRWAASSGGTAGASRKAHGRRAGGVSRAGHTARKRPEPVAPGVVIAARGGRTRGGGRRWHRTAPRRFRAAHPRVGGRRRAAGGARWPPANGRAKGHRCLWTAGCAGPQRHVPHLWWRFLARPSVMAPAGTPRVRPNRAKA